MVMTIKVVMSVRWGADLVMLTRDIMDDLQDARQVAIEEVSLIYILLSFEYRLSVGVLNM